MVKESVDPRSFVPLTAHAYQVLLALADADRHGYGIIREIDERTEGLIRIRTGTLYTLVQRLLDERLIQETDEPHIQERDTDQRRRYYRLTELGRSVLVVETRRLAALVADARRKRVLSRT